MHKCIIIEGEVYFFCKKFGGMKKKQYLCIASSG